MNQPKVSLYQPGQIVTVGSHQVKILKYLTSGGFAQVYRAEISPSDPYTNSNIACLKRVIVPDKQSLNALRAEVEAMKMLRNNRFVVSYIDSHAAKTSKNDGSYEVFMIMEYCGKGGLIDFLNTRLTNRLREDEILNIMSQTTQGIAAMHLLQPPLIHRDIKIENVLIANNGDYKVCDFGSVCGPIRPPRNLQELEFVKHDIMRNTTAQYRSPEMLDLSRGFPVDEKADIWALGVFLYKICYYTTPFEKVGESAILQARFQFPSYPIYSDRLKNLIRVMLAQLPAQRPNICQILEEISRIQDVPCPLRNFYLLRAMESAKNTVNQVQLPPNNTNVLQQPVNLVHIAELPMHHASTSSDLPSVEPLLRISQLDEISKLPVSKSFSEMNNQTTLTSNNIAYTNGIKATIPNLQYPQTAQLHLSAFKQRTNIKSSNIYSNISTSAQKSTPDILMENINKTKSLSPLRLRQNNTNGRSNYINSQTQTFESHSPTRRTLSRVSSIKSNVIIISDTDNINENTTGGSMVRKFSNKLKNVITGESRHTSPVRSRHNTGDSIWSSTMGALRSGFTGGNSNNNSRSVSYEGNNMNSNNSNRRFSNMMRNPSIKRNELIRDAITGPDISDRDRKSLNRRSIIMDFDEHEIKNSRVESSEYYRSNSPVKMTVNKEMKESIQKRVQNLLKNTEDIPTKRTATGYGKYTTGENEIANKTNVRQPSVLVTPMSKLFPRNDTAAIDRRARKVPPPVPYKPSFLKTDDTNNQLNFDTSRIASDATDVLIDVDIDDLTANFSRRFPSTVR